MAQLTFDQIISPFKTTSTGLSFSGSLDVTGSAIFTQTDPLIPAITISGSAYVVDSPNVASGSVNIDQYDTIGDANSPDVEDLGTF
jgi:hypothetical protein